MSSKKNSNQSDYKTRENRNRHKFHCGQCNYKATQKGDLLRHVKSIHEGVKYPCGQCDYKATQKKHLLRHIKSIHEGVRFTQRKKLKILLNLLRHWTAGLRSGRLVLCTKINGRNLIQKLIYNVTIWISLVKLYQ